MNSKQQPEFDVIIVGGGAIGGTLALQLSDAGYRVALIEAQQPSFDSTDPERVIALSHGSRSYFGALGLWAEMAADGAGLIRHIDVSEPGNSGHVTMDTADAKVAATDIEALGYVVEMAQVLRPIYRQLEGKVSLICPARVTSLRSFDSHVEVSFSDNGEERHLSTSLLIGADGTNSRIRSLAGIGTHGWDYNRYGLVASVTIEKSHDDVAYECFRRAGPLAFLPLADGRYSIVWALEPSEAVRMLSLPDIVFIKKLEKAAGPEVMARIGSVCSIGKRGTFPLELTVAKEYAKNRVMLAGNAAHTMHPVAGQGMNLGLRDVAVLVDVLSSDAARKDPGAPILLQAYAEQRRADVLAVAGFTESMVTGFGIDFSPAQWLRASAMNTLEKMPSLRNMLLKQAAGIAQMKKLKQPAESIG